MSDGLWEAWIEFYPRDGGEPARTRRETEQLTRGDLRFWAAGITRTYLAQALVRAISPAHTVTTRELATLNTEARRRSDDEHTVLETDLIHSSTSLNPMSVYRKGGEYVLRQKLRALDARQLRDLILAYGIPELDIRDATPTFEDALAERIVVAAQQSVRAGGERTRPDAADRPTTADRPSQARP